MATQDSSSQYQQPIPSSSSGQSSGNLSASPSKAANKKSPSSSRKKSSTKKKAAASSSSGLKELGLKTGFIVTIDGPAGAGKSTVSKQLAESLDGILLDTGGMYRSVAYYSIREGVTSAADLGKLARRLEFDVDPEAKKLLTNGEDLGHKIRTEEVSNNSSAISKLRSVRTALTSKQRSLGKKWAKKMPVVVEGRDIGTVVFKAAPFKFFVTASPEVRAERRLAQLERQGVTGLSVKAILKQNEQRDKQDSTRKIAPLKCPDDAVIVDTSSMGIAQVVHFMGDHIRNRLLIEQE
jgi:CMP/dCMP kinase